MSDLYDVNGKEAAESIYTRLTWLSHEWDQYAPDLASAFGISRSEIITCPSITECDDLSETDLVYTDNVSSALKAYKHGAGIVLINRYRPYGGIAKITVETIHGSCVYMSLDQYPDA